MKLRKQQTLREWLDARQKNQEWLAGELRVSRAHVSMLLAGKRSPSLTVAARIEGLTGIPARSFAVAS